MRINIITHLNDDEKSKLHNLIDNNGLNGLLNYMHKLINSHIFELGDNKSVLSNKKWKWSKDELIIWLGENIEINNDENILNEINSEINNGGRLVDEYGETYSFEELKELVNFEYE